MRKNKVLHISVAALLLVTVVAAAIHLTTREVVPAGALRVESDRGAVDLFPEQLTLVPVQGEVVDGKGETLAVDGQGVLLSAVLAGMPAFEEITVVADDAYQAAVTATEVESGQVYLLREENSWQMVVFGDENSKRNVKNVVRLVVS